MDMYGPPFKRKKLNVRKFALGSKSAVYCALFFYRLLSPHRKDTYATPPEPLSNCLYLRA